MHLNFTRFQGAHRPYKTQYNRQTLWYSYHTNKKSLRPGHVPGRAVCCSEEADQSLPRSARDNQLSATIRRKKAQVEAQIDELGMDSLQERLESAAQMPAQPSYRLSTLIQDIRLQTGRPVLIIEIAKPTPSSTPEDVGRLAAQYAGWGADALAVLTDLEFTSSGYADLVAACRAARVPVLQRDWILHPIQIVDAKEAGAAGVLGTIASVSVKGAPVLSSFAAALGLDAPVEVVNKLEVEAMGHIGVPFFGINLAVGLSLALPGFKTDITKGLLGALPQGASSLVGVTSIEEAVKAHAAGADAILVKREMLLDAEREAKVDELLERLKYATCGDD